MPDQVSDITNPIQDSQKWINQIGYEGSFTPPPENNLLLRGLMGAGIGLTSGAVRHKNMWSSAARTGTGTVLGQLLGQYFSNPENQQTNGTVGALIGGGIGLGSSLLMDKKKKESINIPGGLQLSTKTASIQNFLESVKNQLPVARTPDMIGGAAVGGGAGWLYDKMRAKKDETPDTQHKNKWRRIIGGAGLGALGANVVGDRARRYISNTIIPYGYKDNIKENVNGVQTDESPTSLMKPSLKKLWSGAVLDRPQQPGVSDYLAGKYQPPGTPQAGLPSQHSAANLAARRELLRLGMGVGAGENSIWKKQTDGSYSLNPQHKNVKNLLQEFMYPEEGANNGFLNDPVGSIADLNEKPDWESGLMTPISGGQRVPLFPYKGQVGNDYLARFLKKFNVDVRPYERDAAVKYLKDKYLNHVANPSLDPGNMYSEGQKPNDQLKTLAKRYLLEHGVMKNSPWVSQRMYFKQLPGGLDRDNAVTDRYASIPATAEGELYPGKSIGTYDALNEGTKYVDAKELQSMTPPGQ